MLAFIAKFCMVQEFTLLPVSRRDAGAAQAPRMAPGILKQPLPDLSPQARGPTASASCRAYRAASAPDGALPAQALVAAHYREASEARKRLPPPSDAAVRCAGLLARKSVPRLAGTLLSTSQIRPRRRSGTQGAVEPFTVVDDPCAWRAADWAGREREWALELTPAELADLDAAVRAVEADPKLRLEVLIGYG